MNDSVVIYKSEFERAADQFYYNNPEYVLYVTIGVVIVLGIFWLFSKFSRK